MYKQKLSPDFELLRKIVLEFDVGPYNDDIPECVKAIRKKYYTSDIQKLERPYLFIQRMVEFGYPSDLYNIPFLNLMGTLFADLEENPISDKDRSRQLPTDVRNTVNQL